MEVDYIVISHYIRDLIRLWEIIKGIKSCIFLGNMKNPTTRNHSKAFVETPHTIVYTDNLAWLKFSTMP